MAFPESVSDRIRVERFKWSSEGILLGISDNETLGLYDSKIIGVTYYFKLVEELGCKEGASLGVSE